MNLSRLTHYFLRVFLWGYSDLWPPSSRSVQSWKTLSSETLWLIDASQRFLWGEGFLTSRHCSPNSCKHHHQHPAWTINRTSADDQDDQEWRRRTKCAWATKPSRLISSSCPSGAETSHCRCSTHLHASLLADRRPRLDGRRNKRQVYDGGELHEAKKKNASPQNKKLIVVSS